MHNVERVALNYNALEKLLKFSSSIVRVQSCDTLLFIVTLGKRKGMTKKSAELTLLKETLEREKDLKRTRNYLRLKTHTFVYTVELVLEPTIWWDSNKQPCHHLQIK